MAANLQIIISAKDDAQRVLRGVSNELKNVGQTMESVGRGMSVGITMPVLGIGAMMGKLAMDAVESENLFEVSMKGMAASARQWSDEVGKALGLNAYQVRKNVGVFNSMFTSMGLGEGAALGMSESLTQLSYDMASFYNLDPETAFTKLRAGIMGEIEPLRQLGVIVNETTTKQWALDNGLISLGQELTEGQKILARYGVIMESTANAQGDMARTIDSPTNALRRMRAQFEEIAISAGQVFLPEVSRALSWINNEGIPRVRAGLDEFKDSWAGMSDEARVQMMATAALFVGGGPLLLGLSYGYKAVISMIAAFKTLRIAAVAELAGISLVLYQIGYQASHLLTGQGMDVNKGTQEWLNWIGSMGDGVIKTLGGVMSLDEAMNALGDTMGRNVVAMPSIGDLQSAMGDKMGPFTQAEMVKNYENLNNVIIRTSGTIQAQQAPLQLAQQEWGNLGGAASKAGKDVADSARGMISSTSAIVDYMVRMHPASIAAAAAVSSLKAQIVGVQGAIAANNDAIHEAQGVLSALQERVSALSEELSKAKSHLDDLANTRLTGMGGMDDEMFQIEQQIKRLKLEQLGQDSSIFAPLTAEARAFAATLPTSIGELEKMLEIMRLTKGLRYDEQLKAIQEAAKGKPTEMSFADAMKQIAATKNQISGLEMSLVGANAAVKGQQAAIAALQETGYQLGKQLETLQGQLQGAEDKQVAVTEVLKTAAEWEIEHKQKLIELGGEYGIQAEYISEMTRKLIGDISQYAQDTTAEATRAIRAIYQEYEDTRAKMAGGGAPALPSPPPPSNSSSSGGTYGDQQSKQTVNVYITVQGSVTAEKDLAQTIRRELIKTGNRNVNVGLA